MPEDPSPCGAVRWRVSNQSTGTVVAEGSGRIADRQFSVEVSQPLSARDAWSGFSGRGRGRVRVRDRLVGGSVQVLAALASQVTGGQHAFYRKRLRLDDNFSLVLVERPTRRGPGTARSFALAAEHVGDAELVMFTSDDGRAASDVREQQYSLVIDPAEDVGGLWEIGRTSFSSDMVLPLGPGSFDPADSSSPRLSLHIERGSSVTWPSGSLIRLRPQLRPRLAPGDTGEP